MNNVTYSRGLSDSLRDQIRALDRACSEKEPLCMKLNWDMLETRPEDEVNDLLWYEDGCLAGYLGLYCIGGNAEEIEITGMVHPDYRRKGIFTKLFGEAVSICRSRGFERILLIAERRSLAGGRFAKAAGLTYNFSEYRMICDAYRAPSTPCDGFSLRAAAAGDIPFLEALDRICFGSAFPGRYEQELERVDIAVHNGFDIGKTGLSYENGLGYVFGVCILPEFRGRGFGRAMLDAVLKKHFDTSCAPVILEVAVKNESALTLYKSCGFSELTVYDYNVLKL